MKIRIICMLCICTLLVSLFVGCTAKVDVNLDVKSSKSDSGSRREDEDTKTEAKGINSYRGELSWIEWYIKCNYGEDAFDQTRLYEIFDSEAEMVVAEIRKGKDPQYLLFDYNRSLPDWYLYNHDVHEVRNAETASGADGSCTVKLTDPDYPKMSVYLNYNSENIVDSVVYQTGLTADDWCYGAYFGYEYDRKGRVSSILIYDDHDLLDESILTGKSVPGGEDSSTQEYRYTKEGYLSEITATADGETGTIYRYEYEGDKRISIECPDGPSFETPGELQIEYDPDGKVSKVHIIGEDEEYSLSAVYNEDGTVRFE